MHGRHATGRIFRRFYAVPSTSLGYDVIDK